MVTEQKKPIAAPSVHTCEKVTLRVLGTGVTLVDTIREQACADLGLNIEFQVLDGVGVQQQAVMHPQSFDVYDQWFHSVELLWLAGAIQPIDINRIQAWDQVNALSKEGRLTADVPIAPGDAPIKRLYVQGDGSLGRRPRDRISMLPGVHNVDSFGYNLEEISNGVPYGTESWGWLLDEKWRGRVALVNDPAIGVMDAILAVRAAGLMTFEDIGNITLDEIDALIAILMEKKNAGHFKHFWNSFAEADELMARRDVAMESMWSPSVTGLRVRGVPVCYAAPKEGYRAWHGGMCISSRAKGRVLDAAYEYLNWWMSGWAGAVMARQGYYFSIPELVRDNLTEAEWKYWYQGEAAPIDLQDPNDHIAVHAGEIRDGGSYWQRFANIGVWNSIMDEHNYLVRRWNEMVAS